MKNELIFFIDQSEIAIFRYEAGSYENVKVKGEALIQYESLHESLVFLEGYLKSVLGFSSYQKCSLLFYLDEVIKINVEQIQNIFDPKDVLVHSLGIIKAYNSVIDIRSNSRIKEIEQQFAKKEILLKERVEADLSEINHKYDSIKKLLSEKEEENRGLAEKAKLWDNHLKEKSKIKRTVVLLPDAFGISSISFEKRNKEKVKESDVIAKKGTLRPMPSTLILAKRDGYIYWLVSRYGLHEKGWCDIDDFKIKDEQGNIILGVISDSTDDTIEEILEFVKEEINRDREIKI
ncbi:MAG: hypothetical protein SCALA702_00690 [Melioribacteraceae bacterium]|nr:MAG: hypothetical protein SCALA702_00690 [Melioribacteraceae bacterium]